MTKILTPISTENKRQIRSNDKSAILTFAAAIVLLGAFFAINPINLTVFAAVDPGMIDNSTGSGFGPVHPGDFLVEKNVTLVKAEHGLDGLVNVTFNVFNHTTTDDCLDLTSNIVINLTTANTTINIDTANDEFLLYDEFFIGMPGVYHCDVVFTADNGTDTAIIGNQTAWIDGIGSKGFWKNHPNATEQHLPITLGNFDVLTNETATDIFQAHKGKFDLDKLAGQLLAAKLNIWALNMTEPFDKVDCIAGNVTAADDYLAGKGYNGVDSGTKVQKSEKAEAFGYHSALDDFNNGGCPLP